MPEAAKPSAGQEAELPLHVSVTSQMPAEPRQVVVEVRKTLAGQAPEVPVHVSARSQTPAEARHTVDEGASTLAGQVPEVPVQVSAGSQMPVPGRHWALENEFAGQEPPLQVSGVSQTPAEARQRFALLAKPHPLKSAPGSPSPRQTGSVQMLPSSSQVADPSLQLGITRSVLTVAQRHLEPVPGTASAGPLQTVFALLS